MFYQHLCVRKLTLISESRGRPRQNGVIQKFLLRWAETTSPLRRELGSSPSAYITWRNVSLLMYVSLLWKGTMIPDAVHSFMESQVLYVIDWKRRTERERRPPFTGSNRPSDPACMAFSRSCSSFACCWSCSQCARYKYLHLHEPMRKCLAVSLDGVPWLLLVLMSAEGIYGSVSVIITPFFLLLILRELASLLARDDRYETDRAPDEVNSTVDDGVCNTWPSTSDETSATFTLTFLARQIRNWG